MGQQKHMVALSGFLACNLMMCDEHLMWWLEFQKFISITKECEKKMIKFECMCSRKWCHNLIFKKFLKIFNIHITFSHTLIATYFKILLERSDTQCSSHFIGWCSSNCISLLFQFSFHISICNENKYLV